MSKLRLWVAAVVVVLALSPFAVADVQLRQSEIIHCEDCWGRWADFNGDGLDDYLVRNRLYFNLGGRLDSGSELRELAAVEEVIRVADFNDDGRADLLTYTGQDRPDVPPRMLLGNGTGRFFDHAMPPGDGWITEAADFTNDGVVDLLRWNGPTRQLELLRGNGDATFTLHQVLPWSFEQAYYFTPADINGDGLLDIVSPYEDFLHILYAQPDGQFGAPVTRFTRFRMAWSTKVADVNGDGKADLITSEGHDGVPGITVLFGDGTGRFPGVTRYVVPPPAPGTMVQYGAIARPYSDMFPGGGATEVRVADFIAGGSNEIAFGKMGDGYVVILGVADGKLVELARKDVEPAYPLAAVVRFTADEPQLVVFGQWYDASAPKAQRLRYTQWFVEPEGAIAQASVPVRRRGRAIGRSTGFTGGRYNVSLEGDCPVTSLHNWNLEVEGMFVHVDRNGAIQRGDAVYLDGDVFMRLHVKDGAKTRVLEGTLKMTELGLSGKLFEWGDSPCGGRWQVHRVEASLSH
jgi:hypothetical protein